MSLPTDPDPRLRAAPWLAAAAAALLLLPGLGAADLWAPDEPRYGRIAEELRALPHGASGLVLLRLNGEPYTQKPPLYYWLAAAFGATSGHVSEAAARLPSALAGIAVVAGTVALGQRLFATPGAALWAGAVLLTTWRFAMLARRAQLDVLLTAFELVAFIGLWRAARAATSGAGDDAPAPRVPLFVHAALGAAVLTKGPVGLLPLLAWAVFLAWEGRLSALRGAFTPAGLALALGPGLLWIGGATALAPAGFFEAAVVENLAQRFFAGTAHIRPFYYFAIQLPIDAMPWTLAWPVAAIYARQAMRAKRDTREARSVRFLIAWIASFVVFFSLSAGKRGLYLLPIFPALALLSGAAIDSALRRGDRHQEVSAALTGAALALSGTALVLAWHGGIEPAPGFRVEPSSLFALSLPPLAGVAASVAWRQRGGSMRGAWCALPASLGALYAVVFLQVLPDFDAEKSPRPLAEAALRAAGAGAIGVFDHTALTGGVAYYARRPVAAVPDLDAAEGLLAGGGVLIVRKDAWPRLQAGLADRLTLHTEARLRTGRRETRVVRAAAGPP